MMHNNISGHISQGCKYKFIVDLVLIKKYSDQFGKLLLQMCNSTKLLIANSLSLWPNTNGFTCRKHNRNSLIDYVLLSEGILDRIHNFSLGEWTLESDHRALYINLKCMHRFDCEKGKLDPKTRPCIFLGYGDDEFRYRVWDPVDKKVFRSRDIIFMGTRPLLTWSRRRR